MASPLASLMASLLRYEVLAKAEQLRELVRKIDEDEAAVRAQEPGMLAPSYDFPTQLAALVEDVRQKEFDLREAVGLIEVMEKARTRAESTGKCMICSQKVDHALIQDRFVNRIQKLKEAQKDAQKDERVLQEARDKVRRHQQLFELTEQIIKRKASEKPALEQMLEAARADHERLKREHEAKLQAAREARDLADKARDLKSDVDHLNHLFRDWSKEQTEVGTIQSGMQSGMGTLHRRRDVVEAEKVRDGLADGLTSRLADGLSDGLADGLADGLTHGLAHGLADGRADGLAHGLAHGPPLMAGGDRKRARAPRAPDRQGRSRASSKGIRAERAAHETRSKGE